MTKMETLVALLPICARCKRIRDEKGHWRQVDAYIAERSDPRFSRRTCADCLQTLSAEELEEMAGDTNEGQG